MLRDCRIPLVDGSSLAADVYLPEGLPPGPALITLLPYHKDGAAGVSHWVPNHFFASRGLASILVDLRGLGGSTGVPRPPLDPGEADDGVAAVEWAAAQSWCDGSVGLWGASYGGLTALRTAARRPAALRAVVAAICQADPAGDQIYPGGARGCFTSHGLWGLASLNRQLQPPLHHDAEGQWLATWRERLDRLDEPYIVDLVRHGPDDPVWASRAVPVSDIEVPTWVVGGWRDALCEGTVRIYEQLRSHKKLLIGPWMHTRPDVAPSEPIDFLPMALRWWNRWLREERNGIDEELPVTTYMQGADQWTQHECWPPPSRAFPMYPSPGGELVEAPPQPGGKRSLDVDPTVGGAGGLWWLTSPVKEAFPDQHADDARSLTFTGAPAAAPIDISGRGRVTLTIALQGSGRRTVVVKIADVDPAGRSTLITTGTWSQAETEPGSNVATMEYPDQIVEIPLAPTSYRVPQGHRLRLVVAGADFPRLWPDPYPGRITVNCLGDALRSVLTLPISTTEGLPVEFSPPATEAQPSPLAGQSNYMVDLTSHKADSAVTFAFGDRSKMSLPAGGELSQDYAVRAKVARFQPDAAQVTGEWRTTLETGAGYVVVDTRMVMTSEGLVATGTVSWQDVEVFSAHWRA